jgi:hypothetical protein
MRWLDIGGWKVAVDEEIAALAAPRCSLERFWSESAQTSQFAVRRLTRLPEGARAISHPDPALGAYAVTADGVTARIVDDPIAAEGALRAAFHAVTLRQGGLLFHSSAVAFGDVAVVGVGASGAGKTTLARLCCAHGGAKLMSDEIVALYPDGGVRATPFRSDQALEVECVLARGAGLFALRHAGGEQIAPLEIPDAVALLVSQAYRFAPDEMTRAEMLQRAGRIVESIGPFRLSFRPHPAVGPFMRDWVARRDDAVGSGT